MIDQNALYRTPSFYTLTNLLSRRLPSRMPPVDPEVRPRHEATRLAHQEHRRTPILFWCTQPLQHILISPFGSPFGKCLEKLRGHGRDDVAWRDGVDPNTVRSPLGCKVARELQDTSFRGVIRRTDEALLFTHEVSSRSSTQRRLGGSIPDLQQYRSY